jgi:hypothetical protein
VEAIGSDTAQTTVKAGARKNTTTTIKTREATPTKKKRGRPKKKKRGRPKKKLLPRLPSRALAEAAHERALARVQNRSRVGSRRSAEANDGTVYVDDGEVEYGLPPEDDSDPEADHLLEVSPPVPRRVCARKRSQSSSSTSSSSSTASASLRSKHSSSANISRKPAAVTLDLDDQVLSILSKSTRSSKLARLSAPPARVSSRPRMFCVFLLLSFVASFSSSSFPLLLPLVFVLSLLGYFFL